jgi:hypothetical protein
VACAHKEVHPTDTVNGTGGSAAAAPPARQLQTMYVSQLPQGATLFSGPPLRASASSQSLGRLSRAAGSSTQNLQEAGSTGGSGEDPAAGAGEIHIDMGMQEPDQAAQQQQQQQQQQQRRPSLLSVAYLGSGVYLWGARRDPLYRDRVHGRAPPSPYTH